ncbi:hypothetical protein M378DRAFT_170513 [Amanita muscaria Koide BX008]|uniref:Uncharacterized protein n=1 Tax=Amanita muscaria (strain Koide BX008) TaxID=946122 RepID=A0A0C2WB94_AMAMK|nr:hypothetical protein M378DRAFT_170513 [Amanita muscaria Koide BX008]
MRAIVVLASTDLAKMEENQRCFPRVWPKMLTPLGPFDFEWSHCDEPGTPEMQDLKKEDPASFFPHILVTTSRDTTYLSGFRLKRKSHLNATI